MTWPGITDFSEAIQNPSLCFKGTELEAATVAVNQRGTPLVFSGAFASVYSVSVGGRTFAVRCFTREVKDQEARYNELSNYLINVLPPSFVHFEYLDEGIRFKGDWYPMVKMEWVEGEVLSSFVGARLGEPDTLRRVAAQWRGGPAASLRGLRIAHNDLQHGNVMVQSDGRIRLVDYDGMFLPKFSGERSPELGHKNYQHPERTADDYGEYIDNFPSFVIYLSLLAVASDPNLWHFYNDDNLIFTRSDYAEPGKSEVFQRLKSSSDATVSKLAESLEECCAMPVDDVPDLETILRSIPQSTAAAPHQAALTPPTPSWGCGSNTFIRNSRSAPRYQVGLAIGNFSGDYLPRRVLLHRQHPPHHRPLPRNRKRFTVSRAQTATTATHLRPILASTAASGYELRRRVWSDYRNRSQERLLKEALSLRCGKTSVTPSLN